MFITYLQVWIWDNCCHFQKVNSMLLWICFVEREWTSPIWFHYCFQPSLNRVDSSCDAVLIFLRAKWTLIAGCEIGKSGELSCFIHTTFQHGPEPQRTEAFALEVWALGSVCSELEPRVWASLSSLETLPLRPGNNSTFTTWVGLSHFLYLLRLSFCLFLRICCVFFFLIKGWKTPGEVNKALYCPARLAVLFQWL